MVTCAAWGDFVMTIGNGAVGGDGSIQLVYTIEDVRRDEVFQNEDIVALGSGDDVDLKIVFFSDQGVCFCASLFSVATTNTLFLGPMHLRLNGHTPHSSPLADTRSGEMGTSPRHPSTRSPRRRP